ncbi:MAG: efflux RND transporter periplasmic adaptor subunit [Oceanicaulis sp.]|jgi:RND family efflux transporter MFP subunit|uniref:efflux RND transporter periplasmic adaptor subunit n=1 Tax=unclassified Oceanicaulis TaxID=2632123 RepID=UPI0000668AEE|nr:MULTISPECIES: efflux RND transporter periplasmic adaptor subunit [unclassified Oceanicaulis]EAP90636.1 possible putitive HlyD family secretion protein [Oceanicaulis alexandrii HTCC2633] [Oceanicaulis sp. HTCC2633]MAB68243.1 efflux RND transporter periplasmic adaptor subunit [Oceanicaulis sp.]MBC40192.1 efflux RND transporter periplasmic adaptor subunit [Oceanicaulis sp.]MBG34387.1 efflux RND transporter periplasmic adaptor subunit [Oceanicaulis sp.]|tara:strand:+ start:963 stop:2240 length:1278 start_codon:yes stop_codon:yes gene_type:complete
MSKFLGRLLIIGLPVAVLFAFIVVYVVLAAAAPKPERAEIVARPSAVFVTEAALSPVQLSVTTQGEVTPLTEIDLTAQVSGRITYVNPNFVDGGFFEAGEVLVRLEDADYRLAVTRAEALVAQSRQALVREQAESELAREEWESLGDGEASALTLREPQMAEARAQLASAQASLDEARLNLSRTRISAPFDGRVRAKSADLGQYVGPGTRLGRVFATNRVQVRLPLTNAELAILNLPLAFQSSDANPGRPAHLSASVAGQERHWEGRLVRTDSAINPQTRTMSAIIEVEDPYGAAAEEAGAPLAVGLFVAANIDGRELENAIVLPRSALRGSNEVYVAELDGTLSIRQVNVVDTSAERVVLTAGLEPGDRVVTSPLRGAAEGMLVRAMDANGDPLDPEPEADAANDNDAESEALVQETTTASRAN